MPAHNDRAGSVIREEAYALSKMVDSSGWNGKLVRNITPSDVDLVFDGDGAVIYVDLSINCDNWDDLGRALKGQRRSYESHIRHGPHCAVIAKHSVAPEVGRKIDSYRDIERFQVMIWRGGPVLSPVYDGRWWPAFVTKWVNEPNGARKIKESILAGEDERRATIDDEARRQRVRESIDAACRRIREWRTRGR